MNKLHILFMDFNDAKLEFNLKFCQKTTFNYYKSFIEIIRNVYGQVINAFHGFR